MLQQQDLDGRGGSMADLLYFEKKTLNGGGAPGETGVGDVEVGGPHCC
jgi:hypothetical protein